MVRALLLAAGLAGVAFPCGSQVPSTSAQPSPSQSQKPQAHYEDAVVVTASAQPAETRELPVTVDHVDAREIEARQITSVAEALEALPGLAVVRSGSPGQQASLFVRGAESDQTLVLWNGVELNDPYFGGFNWAFLPTEGVERVEVVRGPSSALYGSEAVGGVVQVITGSDDSVRLTVEAGENAYRRGSAKGGTRLGGVHLDLAGHARRGDGELDNSFFDGEEIVARLDGSRERWGGGLLVRANDSETGIPLSGGQPTPNRTVAWRESQVAVPLRAQPSADWSLDGQLSRVDLESVFRDPDDPFGFTDSATDSLAERASLVATWSPPERTSGDSLWLAVGSEAERLEVTSGSNFGTDLDGVRQETWAGFAQLQLRWRGLTVDLGGRHDSNDVYGEQWSPRLGLSWAFGERSRVRASYGEGFRAPSLGELFFPFSGNPDLRPERSESLELGIEHRRGRWLLSAVAFDTRQRDLIDFDFVEFRNVNIGEAESRGLELSAVAEGVRWSGRFDLTLLAAEDATTGQPLLRRPDESASLALGWRPGRLGLHLFARWVGERPDVDPVTFERAANPSFTTVDLAARWSLGDRWAPYARLENLFDESYQEALGFPALGRTAIVGLAFDLR